MANIFNMEKVYYYEREVLPTLHSINDVPFLLYLRK